MIHEYKKECNMPEPFVLWFDGGSRRNGSPDAIAGSGSVLFRGTVRVWEGGRFLGNVTNNGTHIF